MLPKNQNYTQNIFGKLSSLLPSTHITSPVGCLLPCFLVYSSCVCVWLFFSFKIKHIFVCVFSYSLHLLSKSIVYNSLHLAFFIYCNLEISS